MRGSRRTKATYDEWGSSGTLLLRLTDGKGKARMDWLTADMATKQDNRTPEPSEGPLTPEE